MLDIENELLLNLCTVIHSKYQYFNYSWEYNFRKQGLERTNGNNNIESRFFQTRVFQ